jgi:uncharacterized protein
MQESTSHSPAVIPLPHPWRRLVLGLGTVAVGTLLLVSLIGMTLKQRPVNLQSHTDRLAVLLRDLLVANHVPPSAISEDMRLTRRDETALWRQYEFTVQVPETVSGRGLIQLLSHRMRAHNVYIEEQPAPNSPDPMLVFSLGERVFARVYLAGGAPERPAFAAASLSAETSRVARELTALLQSYAPQLLVRRVGAAEQTDGQARWTRHALALEWPGTAQDAAPAPTAIDSAVRVDTASPRHSVPALPLAEHIQAAMHGQEIAVQVEEGGPERLAAVLVAFQGRPCVDILLGNVSHAALPDWLREPQALPAASADAAPPLEHLPLDSEELRNNGIVDSAPLKPAVPVPHGAPRVAIIVDDGGYGGESTEIILGLDPVLTLSILPNTPFCGDIVERAAALGFEIMLHMPMESPGSRHDFPGQIEVHMAEEEVARLTRDALEQVKYAVGINNHTGSLYTTDREAMKRFLKVVQEEGLFFIDSQTTKDTVALKVAQEMGIPSAARTIFVDNSSSPGAIREKLNFLMTLARQNGSAIGICHFRNSTAYVLAEMLPEIAREGIEIVPVSELIE